MRAFGSPICPPQQLVDVDGLSASAAPMKRPRTQCFHVAGGCERPAVDAQEQRENCQHSRGWRQQQAHAQTLHREQWSLRQRRSQYSVGGADHSPDTGRLPAVPLPLYAPTERLLTRCARTNDGGGSQEVLSDSVVKLRQTQPQQQRPLLQFHTRIKPRRTSIGSGCLEHLPLPVDSGGVSKGHEQPPSLRSGPSFWTNLLWHARRSLPFLGCGDLEGPLPPTPRSATYNGERLHQLGSSMLSFVPAAWTAVQHNCWQKGESPLVRNCMSAELDEDGGSGGSSNVAGERTTLEAARQFIEEEKISHGGLRLAAQQGRAPAHRGKHAYPEPTTRCREWRSRRVTFDAPDLAALVLQSFRRRLDTAALLTLASVLSLLLYYYFSSVIWIATGASNCSQQLATPKGWEEEAPRIPAQCQVGPSVLLQEELQTFRHQVQKEWKKAEIFGDRMRSQLQSEFVALRKQIRDEARQLERSPSSSSGEPSQVQHNEHAACKMQNNGEVNEEWKEPLEVLQGQIRDLIKYDDRITAALKSLEKSFEEVSTFRTILATMEKKKAELDHVLKELHRSRVEEERIDWALESLGASIVLSETVSTLAHPAIPWSFKVSSCLEELLEDDHRSGHGICAGRVVKKPSIMLQPDTHPGNCYPFYGKKGNVTILLPTAVYVSAVAIDGVGSKQFTASTPRRFVLWGYEDPRARLSRLDDASQSNASSTPRRGKKTCVIAETEEGCSTIDMNKKSMAFIPPSQASWWADIRKRTIQRLYTLLTDSRPSQLEWTGSRVSPRNLTKVYLGDYELHKPQSLSVFELKRQHGVPLRKITFEFLDNFGHPYTCVYRLRVHGEKVKLSTLPELLPPANEEE